MSRKGTLLGWWQPSPPLTFASDDVRAGFEPPGIGAVNRRSFQLFLAHQQREVHRCQASHDRAWQERERKDIQLVRETKEAAKLQGSGIIDDTRVVSVDAVAVSSCSRESDSIKDKENGRSKELAAVLGVLKKEVIGLH